jgi:hypothetical protein|tara:strand:+ start:5914 stop:6165 length:252 start_codon:yes stop_codon:yes gene_type:complete
MEFYTQLEKIEKMIEIKTQLQVYGLSNHENMKKFDEIVQKYVKDGEEFTGKIKLHGTNRIMNIKFRNKKKWSIDCHLLYDKNA